MISSAMTRSISGWWAWMHMAKMGEVTWPRPQNSLLQTSFTWDGREYHDDGVDNKWVLCGFVHQYCWLRAAEAPPDRIAFCDKYCPAVVTLPVKS